MLFATHLIGGYIVHRLTNFPIIWVIIGSGFPDIIDKPLGVLSIAPHYHSVGHSIVIFAAILILIILGFLFSKYLDLKLYQNIQDPDHKSLVDPRIVGFLIGWLTHIIMDAAHILINRGVVEVGFVLYPIYFPPKPTIDEGSINFIANFWSNYVGTTSFYIEFIFWILALYLFVRTKDIKIRNHLP